MKEDQKGRIEKSDLMCMRVFSIIRLESQDTGRDEESGSFVHLLWYNTSVTAVSLTH